VEVLVRSGVDVDSDRFEKALSHAWTEWTHHLGYMIKASKRIPAREGQGLPGDVLDALNRVSEGNG
jgi:hypothetical protein